jgi:protease I
MNNRKLNDNKIAILATDGFEQSELQEPMKALISEGATVHIISLTEGQIRGWEKGNWAITPVHVDIAVDRANPAEYTGLVLPGGVMNPDKLRRYPHVIDFIKGFAELGKPIAAICHAPWLLIEADLVNGRTVTSFESIRTDLENAGANWVDQEVVTDGIITTSRKPGDLDAFSHRFIEQLLAETPSSSSV